MRSGLLILAEGTTRGPSGNGVSSVSYEAHPVRTGGQTLADLAHAGDRALDALRTRFALDVVLEPGEVVTGRLLNERAASHAGLCYGARKVWKQLKHEGFHVARCTVARLML